MSLKYYVDKNVGKISICSANATVCKFLKPEI